MLKVLLSLYVEIVATSTEKFAAAMSLLSVLFFPLCRHTCIRQEVSTGATSMCVSMELRDVSIIPHELLRLRVYTIFL